ncbi:MAG TPA: hypothetical protein VFH59_10520 [Frateuria sp.]|uniref:hypothetical protein n=1 Tax=Frateuria sp. TaxID=2211372 RepID=UPI002D806D40|nr:hypothetical protein [Frateuria sp.]HET6805859.1 hypothetical protein [Frateuria sp.]
MPHPLPALAAVLAAPLLGLAMHAASPHAAGDPVVARAAAALPNNLCASCHASRKVVSAAGSDRLATRDLAMARLYLSDARRG